MANQQESRIATADHLSEVARLEASFMQMTNAAIGNIEKEVELAKAVGDHEQKKLFQIQISMYQHAQQIFDMAMKIARREDGKSE